jgi:Nif-specific regulatory protein
MQSAAAVFEPYSSTPDFVGTSAAIRSIDRDIDGAARSDAKVLITGETGVGKDVVANLIHRRSARRAGRFVVINCAGVPDSLLESELFGHARGSFTGAYRDKAGLLELAHNGTVFLDEVGEMSMRMQAVLLRFLETGELQRVGADRVHARVHVRVIAATNRDCRAQIASGAFREDLYYRLNVFMIFVPPLRDRKADLLLLADHFLEKLSREHHKIIKRISTPAIDMLMSYHWPGNVRELENVLERAVLVCDGQVIHAHHLPPSLQTAESSGTVTRVSLREAVAAYEKDMIQDTLKTTRGNRAKAARLLDTTERVLNYKVRQLAIDYRRFRV